MFSSTANVNYLIMTKQKVLQIRAGSDLNSLSILLPNNDFEPFSIKSRDFVGSLIVRVRGAERESSYFEQKSRSFSIQFCGRFLADIDIGDLEWGTVFDRVIVPPWGSSIILAAANLIDPSLRVDLNARKPWLLSPLVCAMNTLSIAKNCPKQGFCRKESSAGALDEKGLSSHSVHVEKSFSLHEGNSSCLKEDCSLLTGKRLSSSQRRSFFKSGMSSKAVITPDLIVSGDFFGPLDFTTFRLNLGLQIDIRRYIKDQPIRFLCRSKSNPQKTYFVVEFDQI